MEVPAKLRSALVGIRYWLFALLFLATSTLLISCTNGSSVTIVKGPDKVTITVSSETTLPGREIAVVATVVDDNGDPIEGLTVEFSISENNSNGALSALSAVTDFNGQGSVDYTAGYEYSVNDEITAKVSIRVDDVTIDVEDTVIITVEPPLVGSIDLTSGNTTLVADGDPDNKTFVRALVRSIDGIPFSLAIVEFGTTLGSFDPDEEMTDASAITNIDGIAEVFLYPGTVPGIAIVTARYGGITEQLEITFTTDAPASVTIDIAETVETNTLTPVTATVKDANDNPVNGQTVVFSIEDNQSGGLLQAFSAVTNINGQASVGYSTGDAEGTDTIKARAQINSVSGTGTVDVVLPPEPPPEAGMLLLGLTDAATDNYQAVYVTIAEVQVKQTAEEEDQGAGWQTILTLDTTYNLLDLVNGFIETLGITELAAGEYNQIRLILADQPDGTVNVLGNPHPYANYLIDSEDSEKELKVPSGSETGIKIGNGFTIVASQVTELILDFNAAQSVVQAGRSGKCLLKPTINVLETTDNSAAGTVSDGAGSLAGVLVSAQTYDPAAADTKDEVTSETASVTDENGAYILYLPPDIYNIVAVKEGYEPSCAETVATGFEEYRADFSLAAAAGLGTATGTVSGLAADDDFASLSFRQTLDCGSGDVQVEVHFVNFAEGGTYNVTLPAGDYELVVFAAGEATQVFDIQIKDGMETVQDINF